MSAGHQNQDWDRRARIEAKLWERFEASHVEVTHESQLHAGHPWCVSGHSETQQGTTSRSSCRNSPLIAWGGGR